MGTITEYRGDAPGVKQVWTVTPGTVEVGDMFRITVNGRADKFVEYTALLATVADVTAGLQALVAASDLPEFGEVVATSTSTVLTLTAETAGVPFEFTFETTNTSTGISVTVVEATKGSVAINEVQKITLLGTPTGGTFAVEWDPGAGSEVTGNIAFDATAATVLTALEALPSVTAGDMSVTGAAGGPWSVSFTGTYAASDVNLMIIDGTLLTGSGTVDIATTTEGSNLSDAIFSILAADTAGQGLGTFTITIFGETTSALASDASAATVQTALEALSSVGTGNVTVLRGLDRVGGFIDTIGYSGLSYRFILHFTGALAETAVTITLNTTGIIDPDFVAVLWSIFGGDVNVNENQILDLGAPTGGTFTLTFGGQTTGQLQWDATSHTVQTALEALSSIGAGNVRISNGHALRQYFVVAYRSSLKDTNVATIQLNSVGLTGETSPGVTVLKDGGGEISEIQSVTIGATGGTFTLTFGGQTTAATAFGAAASLVDTRLTALSTINDVTVTGTGTALDPYLITFTDPSGNVALMTGDATSLTGGAGSVTVETSFAVAVNEVQTVTVDAAASGGSFTLSFGGVETGAIAFDAAAATVDTDLTGLSTIDSIAVTGSAGGPFTVTFDSASLGGTDVEILVADGTLLTGGAGTQTLVAVETTRSSGPNHFDSAGNWTLGRVPDSTNDIKWDINDIDCFYGLLQITTFSVDTGTEVVTVAGPCHFVDDQILRVTNSGGGLPAGLAIDTDYYVIDLDRINATFKLSLTSGGAAVNITTTGTGTHTIAVESDSVEVSQRNSGDLGLHIVNDSEYREYRQHYLAIGIRTGSTNKSVKIGTKDGSGSSRIKIDTGGFQTEFQIVQTGGGLENLPAVMLLNTNTLTDVLVKSGQVGIAVLEGETSSINNITGESGSEVTIGSVTVGGTIDVFSPLVSYDITISSGTLIVH